MNTQRLKKLQASLKHPLLIKKKQNLFYLTGRLFDHRAEEYLLVTKKGAVGFGSGLEQISWISKSDSLRNIGKYLKGSKQLDIEWSFTYGEGQYLKYKIKDSGLKIKIEPTRSQADILRMVKDPGEILLIRKSMQIVEQVFSEVKYRLRRSAGYGPSWTERKLADYIQTRGLALGAEDVSFPAIVASGANAAVPHHVPGAKKLVVNESIILDFGFLYKNYCSDFTRTVFLQRAPQKLARAYEQTEKAYNEAIALASLPVRSFDKLTAKGHEQSRGPNALNTPRNDRIITGNDVYQKSVNVLAEKKLAKYFIHSLGHGTGLEIHELPNLSPRSKDAIGDGMVFSIEPGVYFPKQGGIRIEDLVYMESGKCKKFINVATALQENII